ncbi:MAG: hypothetical protein H6Q10_2335 [Acidobacteria bacterium]|nr:hypothetical protein [Acidobacteriota bacterium]
MLQELAARTGAAAWAIGSMLFFLAVFVAVVAWVALRRPEEMEARARMPLDGDGEAQASGERRAPRVDDEDTGRKPPAAGRKPE